MEREGEGGLRGWRKKGGEKGKRLTDIGISEHEEERQFREHIFVGIEREGVGGVREKGRERGEGRKQRETETKRQRQSER